MLKWYTIYYNWIAVNLLSVNFFGEYFSTFWHGFWHFQALFGCCTFWQFLEHILGLILAFYGLFRHVLTLFDLFSFSFSSFLQIIWNFWRFLAPFVTFFSCPQRICGRLFMFFFYQYFLVNLFLFFLLYVLLAFLVFFPIPIAL